MKKDGKRKHIGRIDVFEEEKKEEDKFPYWAVTIAIYALIALSNLIMETH
ncbi:MAG: hypothetical protein AAF720_02585 [Pseudomonadota bacterium]